MFESKKKTLLFYIFTFLFVLHITPMLYVNANFLGQYFNATHVSIIYGVAALIAILAIVGLRDKLRKFGNYKVFTRSIMIEMIALFVLIVSDSALIASLCFITFFIVHTTTFISLDIFLEKHTQNTSTGTVRGWYLTTINAATVLGPFLASLFLTGGDFKKVYIFVLILLFPILFLAIEIFHTFKDSPYDKLKIWSSFMKVKKNTDLYSTLMANFILQLFYAWMVVYIPLYLYKFQNFSLSEITLILAVALLPFPLVQSTLGKLADTKYGEKEMLVIGFVVLSFFTILISFIESSNISAWIAILFMTRVGAAMVELMTETHLFKRIDSGDLNVISLFRILTPAGYLIGTILGTLFLYLVSFNMIFFILGGIVLYGLRYALTLTDTR